METIIKLIVRPVFWFLRQLFLSCKVGALIHNWIFYAVDKYIGPARFGAVRDNPEARKIAHNGRWKTQTTIDFVRKNYNLDPRVRRRMIDNFLAQRSFVGFLRRWKWTRMGYVVPSNIYLSPTYQCNLHCDGCYAACHKHQEELTTDDIIRIAKEQEQFGALHMVILGGEPFFRDDLWHIYAEFPTTVFDVFTNGTLLGEKEIARVAELGNVRIFISLEGLQETTDRHRGTGVYDKVMNVLRLCQQARIYYCVSVTVGKENFDEVTSDEFVQMLNGFGIFAINYVPYMACGKNPGVFTELSDEQVKRLGDWGEHIQDYYPIFPVIGRNGSGIVTACPAAYSKIHITAGGDIEPCVFCHLATDNVRSTTILKAMNSQFFEEVRLLNRTGISRFNPCKVGKSAFLSEEYVLSGAHPTVQNH